MLRLVVFDLDDTLYPERSYMAGGFRAVARTLSPDGARQEELARRMRDLFDEDPGGVFDRLALEVGAAAGGHNADLIRAMVEAYRNHRPCIEPYPDTYPVLRFLRDAGIRTAIVTDGRADGQRRKVEALGLEERVDMVVLTDSLGPNRVFWKPNPHAFRLVLEHCQVEPEKACYVADNVAKDFQGPAGLGMHTVLIARSDGLYGVPGRPDQPDQPARHEGGHTVPEATIQSLYDLVPLVTSEW